MELADRRRANLTATLGFFQLALTELELRLLHRAFDSWRGLGLIATGMQRAGWDLQLTAYGDGNWRATFYVTGMADSIVGGSAWERTAWRGTPARHVERVRQGVVTPPSRASSAKVIIVNPDYGAARRIKVVAGPAIPCTWVPKSY